MPTENVHSAIDAAMFERITADMKKLNVEFTPRLEEDVYNKVVERLVKKKCIFPQGIFFQVIRINYK